jgi:hypothetical protein
VPGSHLALLARCGDDLLLLFTACVHLVVAPRDTERAAPGCCPTSSGPRGIRTLDLLNAIETRSQLRYGPDWFLQCGTVAVDLEGFEPSTSSVRLKRAPNCATGPTCGLHCTCIGGPCQVISAVLYSATQLNSVSVEAPVARMPGHNGEAGRNPLWRMRVRRCPATVGFSNKPSQDTRLSRFSDTFAERGWSMRSPSFYDLPRM